MVLDLLESNYIVFLIQNMVFCFGCPMVAAGLVLMFSDTLLFQPSPQFPCFAVCTTGPFSCFCPLCHGSRSCLSTCLKVFFLFLLQWVPQTGFAALNEVGEKFPSMQTIGKNPLVYSILSVNFAFF